VKKIKSQPQSIKSPQGKGDLATNQVAWGNNFLKEKETWQSQPSCPQNCVLGPNSPRNTWLELLHRGKPNQVGPRAMFWAQLP